jgi:hypothetical protein
MHLSLATRAIAALVAGLALRDCVLLAASVLLWTGHLQQSLAAVEPDRTKLWLRCIAQGAVLVALGLALAIHTAAVFLVMWSDHNGQPWLSAGLVLLLAFAGGPAQPRVVHRTVVAVALLAALAPAITGLLWTPCAFAIATALLAIGNGGYQLGPMAREVATPGKWR